MFSRLSPIKSRPSRPLSSIISCPFFVVSGKCYSIRLFIFSNPCHTGGNS